MIQNPRSAINIWTLIFINLKYKEVITQQIAAKYVNTKHFKLLFELILTRPANLIESSIKISTYRHCMYSYREQIWYFTCGTPSPICFLSHNSSYFPNKNYAIESTSNIFSDYSVLTFIYIRPVSYNAILILNN